MPLGSCVTCLLIKRAGEKLIRFHHRVDNARDCFNFQVRQQKLEPVRDKMVNPLEHLAWGGALVGDNFALTGGISGQYAECPFKGWKYASQAAKSHRLRVCLHIDQEENQGAWDAALKNWWTGRRKMMPGPGRKTISGGRSSGTAATWLSTPVATKKMQDGGSAVTTSFSAICWQAI